MFILVEILVYTSTGFDATETARIVDNLYYIAVYIIALGYNLILIILHTVTLNTAVIDDIEFFFELLFGILLLISSSSIGLIIQITLAPLTLFVALAQNQDLTNAYNTILDLLTTLLNDIILSNNMIDSLNTKITNILGFDWTENDFEGLIALVPISAITVVAKTTTSGSGNKDRTRT